MANDRHSQSRKSNRNKVRTGQANQSSQNTTSSIATGGGVAVAAPKARLHESSSSVSSGSPNEVAKRAIESVDGILSTLQKDAYTAPMRSPDCEKATTRSSACVVVPTRSMASVVTAECPPSDTPHEPANENGDAWSKAVDAKLNELIERSKSFERERTEIESLRGQLKQAIDTAENRLSTNNDASSNRVEELEKQLIDTQEENSKISKLLFHSRTEYQELLAFIESEAVEEGQSQAELKTIAKRVLEKADARETELSLEVSQLHDQLQFLQSELADAKSQSSIANTDESDLRIQIEQLRSQLLEARHEAVELRMQSNDLGSRLAKYQGNNSSQKSETLSWEQRKEALLQQLEAETHEETPCDPRKVLEIEKVIEQTNLEILRRDQEIADLKTLIEQQSIAHDGMAIGVAAVAEMIESDALIVSERLRLKELREEWEQKQRQAEIEMSMERAKLARERLELQEKTRTFDDKNNDSMPQSEDDKKSGKAGSRGRWLARLGLRDE